MELAPDVDIEFLINSIKIAGIGSITKPSILVAGTDGDNTSNPQTRQCLKYQRSNLNGGKMNPSTLTSYQLTNIKLHNKTINYTSHKKDEQILSIIQMIPLRGRYGKNIYVE